MIRTKTDITCDICGEAILGDYYGCTKKNAVSLNPPPAYTYYTWNTITYDGVWTPPAEQQVCNKCWERMQIPK